MAVRHNFYCPDLSADVVTIDQSEAHHALHVLRIQADDEVGLLDGKGTLAVGAVTKVGRKDLQVRVNQRSESPPQNRSRLTVAVAMPKGDRCKWMFEKLGELGVRSIVPLQTQRANIDVKRLKLDRLHSTLVSAMKQSGQTWLPEVEAPASLLQLLSEPDTIKVMAHPSDLLPPFDFSSNNPPLTLLIGPEGGFTDEEVELAGTRNVRQIRWPTGILRIETAAVIFASQLLSRS